MTSHALQRGTGSAAATSQSRLRARRRRWRQWRVAVCFLAPSAAVMVVFAIWPMLSSLWTSFRHASGFGPSTFAGLANYRTLVHDPRFWADLRNTLYYAAVTTPVSVGAALGLALLLNRRVAARGFLRAAIFVPAVLSLGVMAIVWRFLLDPNLGLLPAWLQDIGISTGNGLNGGRLAMPYVMLVGVWKNVGLYMVMYLGGLQTIPRQFYEAAVIDGASAWRQFRDVTWPLLTHTTTFVFIIAAIGALQAFDQIFVMTRGGPYFKTETLVYLVYRQGFQDFDFGYASAVAWILVLLVFTLSIAQNYFFSRRSVEL